MVRNSLINGVDVGADPRVCPDRGGNFSRATTGGCPYINTKNIICEISYTHKILKVFSLIVFVILFSPPTILAQTSSQAETEKGKILITVFLKHNQEKTLDEIQMHLNETGFWEEFPPEGAEVVSWYVMMGIGQVVTLRIPAEKLRELNLSLEKNAWGAFFTEFYPTYDYVPIWKNMVKGKRSPEK